MIDSQLDTVTNGIHHQHNHNNNNNIIILLYYYSLENLRIPKIPVLILLQEQKKMKQKMMISLKKKILLRNKRMANHSPNQPRVKVSLLLQILPMDPPLLQQRQRLQVPVITLRTWDDPIPLQQCKIRY